MTSMLLNDMWFNIALSVKCFVGVISVGTDRPVVGRRVRVGAVEVGHSIAVGVGIACGRGQVQGPTGHRQRHGRVKASHRDALN